MNSQKVVTSVLHSPLGYKYRCSFIYGYVVREGMKMPVSGTFYIGNPKTTREGACITISVFYPSFSTFVDPSVASLILVKHYQECAENKGLPSGEGTIDMMMSAMSFVKQICSFVKEFKLNDASTKKCDNGAVISLPYFYITQKGMTWYEGCFGAYLKGDEMARYKGDVDRVLNTSLPEFNIFYIQHIKVSNISNIILDELRSVYRAGDTLRDFFDRLYSKYDKSMGCILLQPWIDTFMIHNGLEKYITRYAWYIDSNAIPVYKFVNHNKSYRTNTFNMTRKRGPWDTLKN